MPIGGRFGVLVDLGRYPAVASVGNHCIGTSALGALVLFVAAPECHFDVLLVGMPLPQGPRSEAATLQTMELARNGSYRRVSTWARAPGLRRAQIDPVGTKESAAVARLGCAAFEQAPCVELSESTMDRWVLGYPLSGTFDMGKWSTRNGSEGHA